MKSIEAISAASRLVIIALSSPGAKSPRMTASDDARSSLFIFFSNQFLRGSEVATSTKNTGDQGNRTAVMSGNLRPISIEFARRYLRVKQLPVHPAQQRCILRYEAESFAACDNAVRKRRHLNTAASRLAHDTHRCLALTLCQPGINS
jgi:hypothetical protein